MARGSPVALLLVLVAMRQPGLSSEFLAMKKQLEDHEVAVLELERQVELGGNFERFSAVVGNHDCKGDWLEQYRQFEALLAWKEEFFDGKVSILY